MPPAASRVPVTRSGRGRRQDNSDQAHRSGLRNADEKPSPSPSKRQKRDHIQGAPTTPLKSQATRPENMYSFTSNLVDLTSSPTKTSPGSPSPRKITNGVRLTNAAPTNGAKRLVVKNFKKTTKSDPEEYFGQVWTQLNDALEAIFTRDVKPFSMEQLYRGVENVCRQNYAPSLFRKLQAKCKNHIVTNVNGSLVKSSEGKSDTDVLKAITDAWATWRRQMV